MTQVLPISEASTERAERCLAIESVFYALFRVAEIAEYAGSDTAVDWARGALDDRDLLHGFVERVREAPRREVPNPASRLAAGSRSH